MKLLILLGGILYLAGLGFWNMGKIDHFLDRGGFLPDWEAPTAEQDPPPHESTPPPPSSKP